MNFTHLDPPTIPDPDDDALAHVKQAATRRRRRLVAAGVSGSAVAAAVVIAMVLAATASPSSKRVATAGRPPDSTAPVVAPTTVVGPEVTSTVPGLGRAASGAHNRGGSAGSSSAAPVPQRSVGRGDIVFTVLGPCGTDYGSPPHCNRGTPWIDAARPDGSGLVKLVDGAGPVWSPDHTTIAYGCPGGGVCIFRVSDGHVSQLIGAGSFPGVPAWSPDGRQIAYAAIQSGGKSSTIRVINVDGTGDHDLMPPVDGTQPFSPSWSPDGAHIAFVSSYVHQSALATERGGGIYTIAVDGSDERLIRQEPDISYSVHCDYDPKWSPDGSEILFNEQPASSQASNPCDVAVMRPDGSDFRQLTFGWNGGVTQSWSPDGTQIVVGGAPPPNQAGGIWTMTAAGGSVREVFASAPSGQGQVASSPNW